MPRLQGILLLPPLAFARLGDSTTPVDAFDWTEDPNTHGGGQTVIRPAVTLRVQSDGSVRAELPPVIQFRDGPGGAIRPTAPFMEIWARFDDSTTPRPLTASTLETLGGALARVTYQISAANLKAARRTKDPACGFGAEVRFPANDHTPQALLATSPNIPGSEPLVKADAPILLGSVQAIRPFPRVSLGVDLDVLRLRFTPASGEVYGPPGATFAADPDAPAGSIAQYEIVPERNRILNPQASWCSFRPTNDMEQPEPADTFDGVLDLPTGLGGQSWGVVDDTCDVIIRVTVEIGAERFQAVARATAGPPDFAPDRRPFASAADDLADRDLPALTPTEIADPITVVEVADLLRRVFETVSLTNLDALRRMMLTRQDPSDPDPVPHTDLTSMTAADVPLADQVPAIVGGASAGSLGYTLVAHDVHSALVDIDNMISLFRNEPDRIRHLLRPPFAHVADLPATPVQQPPTDQLGPNSVQVVRPADRDPRAPRDMLHDMRMPPYMRDADASPLSLSWRQYREVIALIDRISTLDEQAFAALSPVRRHVARVMERRLQATAERAKRAASKPRAQ